MTSGFPAEPTGPIDLAGSFEQAAQSVGIVVHRGLDDATLAILVKEHEIHRAVVANETVAVATGEQLQGIDVEIAIENAREQSGGAPADLGVSAAIAAVASTGALALTAPATGPGGVTSPCLAARVHLCLVPPGALVATSGDLLRPFTERPRPRPARQNLVLITGPSPPSPTAVHVALLG